MDATLERMHGETTQMNTRINALLKERGDRALARAGYTPSQAVRSLYAFAVEHENDPEAIATVLSKGSAAQEHAADEELARKRTALDQAARLIEDACKALGIPSPKEIDDRPYKEFRDEIMDERLREKGLA